MMKLRRLIASPEAQDTASYRFKPALGKARHVRFGSKADMCSALADVR
jgi:hypothetical protein